MGQRKKPQNDPTADFKPIHFGFTLGINTMDFSVVHNGQQYATDSLYADVSTLDPGFHVGIVSDFRISDDFCLRILPGLSFGQRNLKFYRKKILVENEQIIESSYIDMPVLIKYKSVRLNNMRPYLIAGTNFRFDVAARKAYDEDKKNYIRLKRFDYFYELGFGIDFYLQYFKFSPEVKYSMGNRDVMMHDQPKSHQEYVNAITSLRSNMFMLSFHFE